MKKSARISDIFLRVFLSLALVVSFVPIARDASYAAEESGTSSDAVSADTSNGDDDLASEGDAASANGSDADSANGETGAVADSEEGESPAESGSSDGDGSASGNAESQNNATQPGDSDAVDSELGGTAQTQGVYDYAKLMSNGYTYECDESGVLVEIDEKDPARYSIDPHYVKNLIVDYRASSVPERLCFCSTYLQHYAKEGSFCLDAKKPTSEACSAWAFPMHPVPSSRFVRAVTASSWASGSQTGRGFPA